MIVSIIVATSLNNCIGINNKLPWHLHNDLQYFKKLTTNHCIIMGRNTFDSIGKALPNRLNIVLSKNNDFSADNTIVKNNINDALEYCKRWNQQEVFIIGGATIYEQTINIADKIYLTRVETTIANGDAFFPEIDEKKWTLQNAIRQNKDDKNDFEHIFETYIKATSEPIIYR